MKKYLIPALCCIVALIGCIRINIINTEALSPLGNTEDNFELIKDEFGEDFSEFINDKSPIKIYVYENGEGAKVEILEGSFRVRKDNPFLNVVEPVFSYIDNGISNIKDKFDENTENNNENIEANIQDEEQVEDEEKVEEKAKEEIDTIIDDFIIDIE